MKNTKRFTDREWEKIASLLSDESREKDELLSQFLADDVNNIGKQWKELKNMSDEKEICIDKAWNSVYSRIKADGLAEDKDPFKPWFMRSMYMRIAAAALIVLSLTATVVYINSTDILSKRISVHTGNDQKNLQIDLPDGSKVCLNRNTEFTYRVNFGKYKRKVRLSGEAFFQISADESKPFIIDAGKANVKVVGTSFNVITKNSESAVEVFVKTGKVLLSDKSGSKSIILDPGFVGTMNSEVSDRTVNEDPNYLAWNTGLLIYNGQKLSVVFNDLRRVYNMDITADDPGILEKTWTSPIDNQSPDTIIRLICASFNLSYTKDGTSYHLRK